MQNCAATSEKSKIEGVSSSEIKESDEQTHEEVKESDKTEKGAEVVIDIDDKSESSENEEKGKVCRICHLNDESMEILQLGCDCKAELGVSHRHCAQAWFNQRGNRSCEICGKTAKNVETTTLTERQSSRIMVIEWNPRGVEARRRTYITSSAATHDDCRWRCQKSCCNFLLACFVIAIILPWFFRINLP